MFRIYKPAERPDPYIKNFYVLTIKHHSDSCFESTTKQILPSFVPTKQNPSIFRIWKKIM